MEIRVQQRETEAEKAQQELFEHWDLHMPVDRACEREEWMHVLSITEDLKSKSEPNGSNVRNIHVFPY